jgi:hypothetical protein
MKRGFLKTFEYFFFFGKDLQNLGGGNTRAGAIHE